MAAPRWSPPQRSTPGCDMLLRDDTMAAAWARHPRTEKPIMIRTAVPLVLLAVSACVTVRATPLPNVTPHNRFFMPGRVDIRLSGEAMPDNCERLALLSGSGSSGWTNDSQMFNKLRQKAGELGANVVLLQGNVEDPGTGEAILSAFIGTPSDRNATAVAYFCPEATLPQVVPEERAPVTPAERVPATPAERAPATPAERAPATPAERAPATPAERAPATPAERAPATPAERAPATSVERAPATFGRFVEAGPSVVALIRARDAIQLVRMRVAAREANETIAYRDGDRIIAIAHPSGEIEFPQW